MFNTTNIYFNDAGPTASSRCVDEGDGGVCGRDDVVDGAAGGSHHHGFASADRRKSRDASTPAPKLDELHPMVWAAAEPRMGAGHLRDAVMAASRALNSMLQTKVGRDDLSEVKLVQAAFSKSPPSPGAWRLRFPDITNEQTRDSVTIGAMNFGVGCFMAIRNPIGHLPDDQHSITEQEALEQLAAWSLFARWIDRAMVSTEP